MDEIDQWLGQWGLSDVLHMHVAGVLFDLPDDVRRDLLGDPHFMLCEYEAGPWGMEVRVSAPRSRTPSRSVALKRTLVGRPVDFVRWVIAHEFAHAHLRNAGRYPGEDPERAADALAAEWGCPRPSWPW